MRPGIRLALLGLVLLASCESRQPPSKGPRTGLVFRKFYLRHNEIDTQVEHPVRLRSIMARLKETGLLDQLELLEPPPAAIEWIQRVHPPEYVERVRQACLWLKDGAGGIDAGDVSVTCRSFDVAVCAVGGVLGALDAVMEKRVKNAFCAIRPPGHHASSTRAMGFCLFNNVAIAARYLQAKHHLKKIFIIDWDCHHGNGTQEIFYSDPTVYYFSTHQFPFYPLTGYDSELGGGDAIGTKLNIPLVRGAGDAEVLEAYRERLIPEVQAFKPDFILISAGFDAAAGDLLGGMNISPEGFAEMTRIVKKLAAEVCQGRLVSLLEGGYNPNRLPFAVEAHVRALME